MRRAIPVPARRECLKVSAAAPSDCWEQESKTTAGTGKLHAVAHCRFPHAVVSSAVGLSRSHHLCPRGMFSLFSGLLEK